MAKRLNQVNVTSNYAVQIQDEYITMDASSGTVVLTLPSPDLIDTELGKEYIVLLSSDDLPAGFRGIIDAGATGTIEGDRYFLMYTKEILKIVLLNNVWRVVQSNQPFRFKTFNHNVLTTAESVPASTTFTHFDQFPRIYTKEWGWHIVHLTIGVFTLSGRSGVDFSLQQSIGGLAAPILVGSIGLEYCEEFGIYNPIEPCAHYYFVTGTAASPEPTGWYHTFIINRRGVFSI